MVAILATVGALPWWNLVIPLVLVAGFLMVSASAAQRERLVQATGPRPATAPPREGARVEASSAWASAHGGSAHGGSAGGQSYRLVGEQYPTRTGADAAAAGGLAATATGDLSGAPELRADDDSVGSRGSDVSQPASTAGGAVAGTGAPSGDLWDPVRVPLPTYVTKAKAPRTVRTVELADQGTWASARLPEAGMLSRPDETSEMLLDETGHGDPGRPHESGNRDGSDEDRRRAVGD